MVRIQEICGFCKLNNGSLKIINEDDLEKYVVVCKRFDDSYFVLSSSKCKKCS